MRKTKVTIRKSVQNPNGDYITAELSSELIPGDNPIQIAKNLRQTLQEILPDLPYLESEKDYVN